MAVPVSSALALRTVTAGELQTRPYGERQQLLVIPDDIARLGRLEMPEPRGVTGRVAAGRRRLPRWAPASTREPHDPVVRTLIELRDDGVPIALISTRDAAELTMPVGHPRPKVMYVGHPLAGERYYPLADFHRQVFEQKFAEAMRLVMALGAIEAYVHWEDGWRGDVAADLQGPIQKLVKGAGRLTANRSKSSTLLFEAKLEPKQPVVPDGLVWYPHEPAWQAVTEARTHGKLTDFELHVESTDDYGIDATLETKVRRKKLISAGGKFTAHRKTSWRIEGHFAVARRKRWMGRI